ncbi:MAG: sodium ion-translocating decarboxylase subunit beta [Eubacteriales bacterium]|nr:sodium ion-translocating decarboxylase subunit beta [Eubacteriales bacterium]
MNILEPLQDLARESAFAGLFAEPLNLVMIVIACILLYLAIVKKYEPLLLVPIAFGMLLANIPFAGLMDGPKVELLQTAVLNGKAGTPVLLTPETMESFKQAGVALNGFTEGMTVFQHTTANGGLFYYLYQGVKLGIYPPLIFMGVGAMTDFGPLIANPKSMLLGGAAQLGIFVAFILARLLGFTGPEAASVGIIGGADGPTAIYLTGKLAPKLLGPIAVAAYSYMALVPVIQPPIMRALTTQKEREIVMEQLRPVSKREKIIFPIMVTIVVSLILPSATPLVGMLMLGNLFRESLVVDRLNKTAQNELMNIIVIFLGVTVGATANAKTFLSLETIKIIILGVLAFSFGTAGGLLMAKLMNKLSGGKINPLIGSAGVSAVPMAARVSQVEGQKANPNNFLLMHAMGPNVAGVIGSAIAAGVLLSLFG